MDFLFEWSGRLMQSVPRDFRRYLFPRIPTDQRLVIIKGARGTGKTTLLLQVLKSLPAEPHEKIYLSLDHIYFLEHRLLEVADRFVKQGGKYLLLDEIHRYDGWVRELKNLYDHYPSLHVIGTGSSALNIHHGEADLSRRALVFPLNELSLREYLELAYSTRVSPVPLPDILSYHPDMVAEINRRVKPVRIFHEYLRHGAFPYFREGTDFYHGRLRSSINTILESDLPSLEKISYHTVVQVKKLLFIISESVPFTPNIAELSRKMNLSRDVLLRQLFLLEKAELIFQLRRETKGISYLAKPEKLYLHNPNTSYALNPGQPDQGTLRETFILNQLSCLHEVTYTDRGDFLVAGRYTLEVGGKNKKHAQVKGVADAYLALDDLETGTGNRTPIWLFGFLY